MAIPYFTFVPTLRPCIADGKRALFHGWDHIAQIIPPAMTVGGHRGGQVSETLALVERENGQIERVRAEKIRFTDGEFAEYDFGEKPGGDDS